MVIKIKPYYRILFILVLSTFLLGCHKTIVSPTITAGNRELHYEGYVLAYNNQLPQDYKSIKPQIVKPNATIKLSFPDEPKESILKQWVNGKSVKKQKLKKDFFKVPNELGTYIYTIGSEWNILTSSTVIIVLKVQS